MVDDHTTLRVSPGQLLRTRTHFLLACLVESFPIGPERKHIVDYIYIICRLGESHVIIRHSYHFTVSRPSFKCSTQCSRYHKASLQNRKRAFQLAARSEGKSVLDVTNTSGVNILNNWSPSHEDKFATKTRDQPGMGR